MPNTSLYVSIRHLSIQTAYRALKGFDQFPGAEPLEGLAGAALRLLVGLGYVCKSVLRL